MGYLMFVLVLMVVSGLLGMVEWNRLAEEPPQPPKPLPPLPDAVAEPAEVTRACATESDLVARLMRGSLDRADYRRAMADLAMGDALVRPVELPPD